MNSKSHKHIGLEIITLVLLIAATFLLTSILWVLSIWSDLDVNEIIFHLKTPLSGAGNGIITQYMLHTIIPVLFVVVLFIFAVIFLNKQKGFKTLLYIFIAASVLTVVLSVAAFGQNVGLGKYIIEQIQDSPFIEENYVDASNVSLTFPDKKRNLVYLYLESMEMSFSDRQNGGGFDFNCIPELTDIALENECFNGNSKTLNGGYVMPGTNFTMGGLFAQSSGLPLKLGISDTMLDEHGGWDGMYAQPSFFSSITTLGDILNSEGYEQVILFGSDATFGGRRLYFEQHGKYEIKDYNYALENGWIPENYFVFWGYEDEKIFSFAKNELTRLSKQDKPFNLSLLTVDTHFEDGYVCRLCGDEFGDNQYANVMACSSRQVSELIKWIQSQDFYENTTIVINGDHTTMDSDFCDEMPDDYNRKTYTAVINPYSPPENPDKERIYTTMDNFPTTLGALGIKIEGNRLGLGTDLFSAEPTLAETYGVSKMYDELKKKSKFMAKLSNIDSSAEELYNSKNPQGDFAINNIDEQAHTLTISARNFKNLDETLTSAYAIITGLSGDEHENTTELNIENSRIDTVLEGTLSTEGMDISNARIYIKATGQSGIDYPNIAEISGNLYMCNINYYLDYLLSALATGDYSVLMSVNGDAAMSLSDEEMEKLRNMGIREDIQHSIGSSYYAVITGDDVIEELGDEKLKGEGTLPDGSTYSITSQGENASKILLSSVIINGGDHSINRRGLNIVLYNNTTGNVEDSVCFNTNYGLNVSREPKRRGEVDI